MTRSATLGQPPMVAASLPKNTQRLATIDILRALTMVLMIFVNDLWSLKGIPAWLEHVESGVDGIGLADVVFPAFLFIVGLSLPYAIDARRKKGESQAQLSWHVITRTIALLVMGVFLVNGESIDANATGLPRFLWNTFSCISFILIWNVFPKTANKKLVYAAKTIGIMILIILAYIYRGESRDGTGSMFGPKWWGILGLIGWSYLAAGLITVFARNKFGAILGAWIFFAVLSMASKAGLVPDALNFIPNPIIGGTLAGLTMGGVLTTMIFRYFRERNDNVKMTLALLGFSVLLIVLSVITRPYWKLAKLGATPAWLFLCSAFTIIGFVVIYWIADVYKKANWFNFIKPAGTDTLLCYLIPYLLYALLFGILELSLPDVLITGGVGLIKSLSIALICVFITGLLNRGGVKLKL